MRHPGPCLGGMGWRKLPKCPGVEHSLCLQERIQTVAGYLHITGCRPPPSPCSAGPVAHLVFREEGQVHVDIPHRPVVPLELYHCLLHSGVARTGAGEWRHTVRRGFKFTLGPGTGPHLGTGCARPCPPGPGLAWRWQQRASGHTEAAPGGPPEHGVFI